LPIGKLFRRHEEPDGDYGDQFSRIIFVLSSELLGAQHDIGEHGKSLETQRNRVNGGIFGNRDF
jgi:hypothetical protein